MKPIDHEKLHSMEHRARTIGVALGKLLEEGEGFCLMIFTMGGAEMTYISNAERESMLSAIKELTMMVEAKADKKPGSRHEDEQVQ